MIFQKSKKGHRRLSIASGIVSMALVLSVYAGAGSLVRASGSVAKIGDTGYASLSEAFKAAKAGDTVALVANSSSADLPNVGKNLTLDLNGFTYTNTSKQMYPFAITTNATVTIKDSSANGAGKFVHSGESGIYTSAGKFVLEGGTIETSAHYAVSVNVGSITVKGGKINANSADGYALYAYNKNQPIISVEGGEINSKGYGVALADCSATFAMTNGTINSKLFALTTNGSSSKKGTMRISGGTLKSETIAVYEPSGDLSISGGTISGKTAVYMKSGNLKITGGTLEANGPKTSYKYNGNGADATGDALVVDNCGYPNGKPNVFISGGTFKSQNADAVATYAYGSGNAKVTEFISGGVYSSPVLQANCAEGYRPIKNADGTFGVSNLYTVTFDVTGVPAQQVVYGKPAVKPANPTRMGYIFKGWYLNGEAYDFNTPVKADIVLNAKWEEVASHQLTFADFVERLYNVALGRPSEKAGKDFWVQKVTSGEFTGGYCALFFLTGPEFLSKNTSDEEFLTTLYKTFFDRDPEQGGMDFWKDFLKKGNSRQAVIERFVDSTEWCNLCARYGVNPGAPTAKATIPSKAAQDFVTRLYTKCLGRDPEEGGLLFWSLKITNRETTGAALGRFFFESTEYLQKKTTNEAYVSALYETFLGREAETDGFNYWVGQLNKGVSRFEVLRGFAMSPEYSALCQAYGIERGTI
ncbi:MAG: DUF4214 domain-containing protein [Clostridiales bacterium]|nr:DUF4214 domain-containing protein [Clostridiales bacterium]